MTTAPDASSVATDLTNNVGGQVVDTAIDLAPVMVPFLLVLGAVGWVLRKFRMGGTVDLGSLGGGPARSSADADREGRIMAWAGRGGHRATDYDADGRVYGYDMRRGRRLRDDELD